MPSTTLTGTTTNKHKLVGRPDEFMRLSREFFDRLSKKRSTVYGAIAALIGLGVAVGFYWNHQEHHLSNGRNDLYQARQTLARELQALTPGGASAATDADKKSGSTPSSLLYTKMDVDAKLAGARDALAGVAKNYQGTRISYEAYLDLGDLYLNHGDGVKAAPYYKQAVGVAPSLFEKALALESVGYAHEGAAAYKEAIQAYEQALNLGQATLKGDLMLAMGRCHELLGQKAAALSVYEKVLGDLPNTDFARLAEARKSQLAEQSGDH